MTEFSGKALTSPKVVFVRSRDGIAEFRHLLRGWQIATACRRFDTFLSGAIKATGGGPSPPLPPFLPGPPRNSLHAPLVSRRVSIVRPAMQLFLRAFFPRRWADVYTRGREGGGGEEERYFSSRRCTRAAQRCSGDLEFRIGMPAPTAYVRKPGARAAARKGGGEEEEEGGIINRVKHTEIENIKIARNIFLLNQSSLFR